MKKIAFIVFFTFILTLSANAEANLPVNTQIQQNVSTVNRVVSEVLRYSDCAKTYNINAENLLYIFLSALNDNNYKIEEIQYRTGSVLFSAYSKEFFAYISAKDTNNSFIKILPADNNYNFSPQLIKKLHNYIDLNNKMVFKTII